MKSGDLIIYKECDYEVIAKVKRTYKWDVIVDDLYYIENSRNIPMPLENDYEVSKTIITEVLGNISLQELKTTHPEYFI